MKKLFLTMFASSVLAAMPYSSGAVDPQQKTIETFKARMPADSDIMLHQNDLEQMFLSAVFNQTGRPQEIVMSILLPLSSFSKSISASGDEYKKFLADGGVTKFRDTLRKYLGSGHTEEEVFAAIMLYNLDDRESIPAIAKLLDMDRSGISGEMKDLLNLHRAAAAVVLVWFGEAGKYKAKIDALFNGSQNDIFGACEATATMGWKDNLPKIAKMLDLPDSKARANMSATQITNTGMRFRMAMSALASMKEKSYAPRIAKGLEADALFNIQPFEIVCALAEMNAADTAAALAKAYRENNVGNKAKDCIVSALALFGAKDYKNIVLTELKERPSGHAVFALALLGGESDMPYIRKALNDQNTLFGAAAAIFALEYKQLYPDAAAAVGKAVKSSEGRLTPDGLAPYFREAAGLVNADIPAFNEYAKKADSVWREQSKKTEAVK